MLNCLYSATFLEKITMFFQFYTYDRFYCPFFYIVLFEELFYFYKFLLIKKRRKMENSRRCEICSNDDFGAPLTKLLRNTKHEESLHFIPFNFIKETNKTEQKKHKNLKYLNQKQEK